MPAVYAHHIGPAEAANTRRPAGEASVLILVAIGHPMMRTLTCDLLAQECGYRVAGVAGDERLLAGEIDHDQPDVVVLDTAEFPGRFRAALARFASGRVIVIGPEPDGCYRDAALAAGAAAWVSRDRVGDDLGAEVRRVLSRPCPRPPPPGAARRRGAGSGSVVARSPVPRRARMAPPPSPATLIVTHRSEDRK